MDEDHDWGFGADLRVDDVGLNGTGAVFQSDVLTVAWGRIETGFGPVLSMEGCGGQREQNAGDEGKRAERRRFHGDSVAPRKIRPQVFCGY